MSLGLPAAKSDLDYRIGNLCLTLRTAFEDLQHLQTEVNALTDANLTTLGYDSTDLGNLRAALADLNGLAQIYFGQTCTTGYGTQIATGTPYNFQTFAKFAIGFQ